MSAADPIRVLLSKEGEYWVAQCLEYDIGAQARDLDQLRKRLLVAFQAATARETVRADRTSPAALP